MTTREDPLDRRCIKHHFHITLSDHPRLKMTKTKRENLPRNVMNDQKGEIISTVFFLSFFFFGWMVPLIERSLEEEKKKLWFWSWLKS